MIIVFRLSIHEVPPQDREDTAWLSKMWPEQNTKIVRAYFPSLDRKYPNRAAWFVMRDTISGEKPDQCKYSQSVMYCKLSEGHHMAQSCIECLVQNVDD